MDADERPRIRALVCYPLRSDPSMWTDSAVVSLEVAAELKAKGYLVLVDPQDERDLAMYERLVRSVESQRKKRWYET
jgi:hypothetical protein